MIQTTSQPFHIYRSSAGSGKTYTLTKEYLKLALSRPGSFRNILGVTFTNKATEEMKSRIVTLLRQMAAGDNPSVQKELEEALGMDSETIVKAASATLTDILHQYGRFAVVTIDSFFHQVIRSFAKEMGLQGSFSIDLELDRVMQKVVDDMLLQVNQEEKRSLRNWLTQFAEERVENGDSWDIRREISKLAQQVIKDDFKPYSKQILELADNPNFFRDLKKKIDKSRYSFESTIKSLCKQALTLMQEHGVSASDFKGGGRSPAQLFHKVTDKFEISDAQKRSAGDISAWIKAKDPNAAKLETVLGAGLMSFYEQIVQLFENNLIHYQSAKEALRYFYTFGVLAEVNKQIQDYREENDVMLIADLPDFLNQIINESDTPYIYEKVGSMFHHFLIDEFQDTSAFQWENFKPLVKNTTDEQNFSLVVGDVKQSIYRWRGGDWQLLQSQLKVDIGDYHVLEETLNKNWRSARKVVAFNNDFFTQGIGKTADHFRDSLNEIVDAGYRQKIDDRIGEVLLTYADVAQDSATQNQNEGLVNIEFLSDNGEEESWKDLAIARCIEAVETAQEQGYQLRDIAILTRSKPEGKAVANAFMSYKSSENAKEGLSYEVVSSEALYLSSSHLVKFLISLIRWIDNQDNDITLAEWLYEYECYVLKSGKQKSEVFSQRDRWSDMVPVEFVREQTHLKTLPLYELVERLVGIFKLSSVREELPYLQGFQDAVLEFSKNERGDIPSFLEWWEDVKSDKSIQLSDQNNAVKIMTIHKAKGLEFPVVIIPFLSWDMDHGFGNEYILWCQSSSHAPYSELPVIPLRYSSKLANTYWALEYYDEKLKAFLDNLNLLYVAFTRPVEALFAFGKLPSKPPTKGVDLKIKTSSDLVLSVVHGLDGFDENEWRFSSGSWGTASDQKVASAEEVELGDYSSTSWREKVQVQMRGARALDEAVFNPATKEGLRMHELLSKIKYHHDIGEVPDTEERNFLQKVIEHPQVKGWFEPKWTVDTEVSFLLPNGEIRRIDRMNRSKDETLVIDFKTGIPREKDKKQVREYISLLEELGLPQISGRLVYLAGMEVVEV